MDDTAQAVSPAPPPLPDIIQRYLNGESMQDLATECRVHRQTIYNWIFSGVGDKDYEQIVTTAMVNRIADADQELDESLTVFDIARAREKMRFTRMDLERRRPKLYGPKQEIEHDNRITVIVQREGQPLQVVGMVIEAEQVEASVRND